MLRKLSRLSFVAAATLIATTVLSANAARAAAGAYGSVALGLSVSQSEAWETKTGGNTSRYNTPAADYGYNVGGDLGYSINDYVGFQVNLKYYSSNMSLKSNGLGAYATGEVDSNAPAVSSYVFMPKVKIGYPLSDTTSISAIGGVGISFNNPGDLKSEDSFLTFPGVSSTELAWSLGAMSDFRLSESMSLTLAVEYTGLGKAGWDKTSTSGVQFDNGDSVYLTSLDFNLGVSFNF